MPFKLTQHHYGKSDVRLTKVIRNGPRHELLEFSVNITLEGDFARSYTHGDNSTVIATDSMKNAVYVLAKERTFTTPETFAVQLAEHFCVAYPQVQSARAQIQQSKWDRIVVNDQPHDHAFVSAGSELQLADATACKSSDGASPEIKTKVSGGITNLLVLKTTESAFKGFVSDRYRTLKDADDRIFATSVTGTWDYISAQCDFEKAQANIRTALLKVFATQMSYAVQETMHQMGSAALAAEPQIARVHLRMPNKHRIPVNLQPFNLENQNEIFVWTDEPFGDISATIERDEA